MSKRQPKIDRFIDGARVRVFTTRSDYEVVFNDDDVDDPAAQVLQYPKVGYAEVWADRGHVEYGPEFVRNILDEIGS